MYTIVHGNRRYHTPHQPAFVDSVQIAQGVTDFYEHPTLGDESQLLMVFNDHFGDTYIVTQWWEVPSADELQDFIESTIFA